MPHLTLRLALASVFLTGTLHAQVPRLINYQGRVAVDAVNFDGPGLFKFALVDGAGTTTLWSSDGTSIAGSQPTGAVSLTVSKGLYSVLLGDTALANMTTIPASVFNNADVRLRVWFNDGIKGSQLLTPDQRIAAVGYAMVADNVPDGAITAAKIANRAVGQTQLAAGAVGSSQLANNSVGSAQLADGAITTAKLAAGAISGDRWASTASGAPSARGDHTAVWTGSETIVWGGFGGSHLNDGARYNPSLNTWTPVSTIGAPAGRSLHTAVWTGTEMIVWGGGGAGGHFNDGARYNPSTDSWTSISANGAPNARRYHTAVWTGTEMIVWGGGIGGGIQGVTRFNDGARYNPSSNTWTAINPGGAPLARYLHTAVWTGSEMIVWGGLGVNFLDDGARYNPASNSWATTNLNGAPAPRASHTAVWTGTRMIVFGGGADGNFNDGARYDPAGNSWSAIASAATPRFSHTAIWTGSEMVVWGGGGGSSGSGLLNTGARYHPVTNTWMAFNPSGAPAARDQHTAVWSGTEMIVWGGVDQNFLNDGARLRLSNILPASIGSGELVVPLRFSGALASGSILSGTNSATGGSGIAGVNTGGATGVGVSGDGGTGTGVRGVSSSNDGVRGESTSGLGVLGTTVSGVAVYGFSTGSGLAARFDGDVQVFGGDLLVGGAVTVTGNLFKGGGAFRIDHPLDPANKYLSHSFVESPDMMNIYNGNITLDSTGEAVVELPEWFGALNKEFRYQLTCLGGFAPVYIAEEIAGNRFKIAGGKPHLKISWQVTGVRQDAWANAHRILIEEEKAGAERGSYLHPEAFDQPAAKSVERARDPQMLRQVKERLADSPPLPDRNR